MEWVEAFAQREPKWLAEPDINAIGSICRTHLGCTDIDRVSVTFFNSGTFNKLYKVAKNEDPPCLMRVMLPMYPRYKTLSEVATMVWVSQRTSIRTPRVLGFDESSDNAIGYEWILMELLPGEALAARWKGFSAETKNQIARDLAAFQVELIETSSHFAEIGSLYLTPQSRTEAESMRKGDFRGATFACGRLVESHHILGGYHDNNVVRGPYRTTETWLRARLNLLREKIADDVLSAEDEDDLRVTRKATVLVEGLEATLDALRERLEDGTEPKYLCHPDLNNGNILCDEAGRITGIIDWEMSSLVPLWACLKVPKLFSATFRDQEPSLDEYPDATPPEPGDYIDESTEQEYDLRGKNLLYGWHYREWECWRLRKAYLGEMQRLRPKFSEECVLSKYVADLDLAISTCECELGFRDARDFIAHFHNGEDTWIRLDEAVDDPWDRESAYSAEDEGGDDDTNNDDIDDEAEGLENDQEADCEANQRSNEAIILQEAIELSLPLSPQSTGTCE
jgi:hypothetical protein